MSDWNPEKYLLFKQQRTQPAVDLAKRAEKYNPKTIADIGCGPGNSTAVLKQVFPDAEILGIDSSPNMIKKATESHPDLNFSVCPAESLTGEFDLLFSNACLQWIDHHEFLIPALMERLTDTGILAVQMPMNQQEPLFRIIREVAAETKWHFDRTHFEKNDVLTPEEYFDILTACSRRFEQWETVYYHAMPTHESLIEWVRSTRLRPYLDALNEEEQVLFEREILQRVTETYPLTKSHEIILKFRRFFFIAQK